LQYPLAGLFLYNAELWQWYLYVLQLAVPSSGPIPLQHIKPEAIIGKVKLAVPSSGPIPLQLHNQTTKNLSQSVLQYPLAGLFLYNIRIIGKRDISLLLAVPSSGPIPLQLSRLDLDEIVAMPLAVPSSGPIPLQHKGDTG